MESRLLCLLFCKVLFSYFEYVYWYTKGHGYILTDVVILTSLLWGIMICVVKHIVGISRRTLSIIAKKFWYFSWPAILITWVEYMVLVRPVPRVRRLNI